MASQVSGYIGKLDSGNGTQVSIGSTAYGYCQTAAATAAKVVDMTGFYLFKGATIFVKFQYGNTASSPTMNVGGTGAKAIYRYGTTAAGTNADTDSWPNGAVIAFTYDGTGWVEQYWGNTHDNSIVAFSGTAVTCERDKEYRNSTAVNSLTITLPDSPNDSYITGVNFTASSSFTGVTFKKGTATYSDMKTVGDGLTAVSKRYNLIIWWDGGYGYYWCASKAV